MLIEEKINELLEKRGEGAKVSKDPSKTIPHIKSETQKKLSFSVSEMLEFSKMSDKIRRSLDSIRSLGKLSLVTEVEDYFKSICVDDPDYQKIFEAPEVFEDPADNYFAICDRLFKASLYLRVHDKFAEIKETVSFLKNLDKGDFSPLSDEAIRRKLSNN